MTRDGPGQNPSMRTYEEDPAKSRMGGVDPRISLHSVEKNGVGGCHFVVNSGFEKALPFFVEDSIIFGHQNEPFRKERKTIL